MGLKIYLCKLVGRETSRSERRDIIFGNRGDVGKNKKYCFSNPNDVVAYVILDAVWYIEFEFFHLKHYYFDNIVDCEKHHFLLSVYHCLYSDSFNLWVHVIWYWGLIMWVTLSNLYNLDHGQVEIACLISPKIIHSI